MNLSAIKLKVPIPMRNAEREAPNPEMAKTKPSRYQATNTDTGVCENHTPFARAFCPAIQQRKLVSPPSISWL